MRSKTSSIDQSIHCQSKATTCFALPLMSSASLIFEDSMYLELYVTMTTTSLTQQTALPSSAFQINSSQGLEQAVF